MTFCSAPLHLSPRNYFLDLYPLCPRASPPTNHYLCPINIDVRHAIIQSRSAIASSASSSFSVHRILSACTRTYTVVIAFIVPSHLQWTCNSAPLRTHNPRFTCSPPGPRRVAIVESTSAVCECARSWAAFGSHRALCREEMEGADPGTFLARLMQIPARMRVCLRTVAVCCAAEGKTILLGPFWYALEAHVRCSRVCVYRERERSSESIRFKSARGER
jgi:hypothetical protein